MGEIEIGVFQPHEPVAGFGQARVRPSLSDFNTGRAWRQRTLMLVAAGLVNVGLLSAVSNVPGISMRSSSDSRPVLDLEVVQVRISPMESSRTAAMPTARPVILARAENAGSVRPRSATERKNTLVAAAEKNADAPARVTTGPLSQSEIERLQGLYRQQIAARVERALEGSAVPRHSGCELQVEQGLDGSILAAAASRCRGDDDFRQRLVAAVRRAAPLPAPPRADVFAPKVVVEIGSDVKVRF